MDLILIVHSVQKKVIFFYPLIVQIKNLLKDVRILSMLYKYLNFKIMILILFY